MAITARKISNAISAGKYLKEVMDAVATLETTVLGISVAELGFIDGVTAGTAAASKALVLDASKELDWAITDAGVGTVTPLDFILTATGVGASVDGAKFTAVTEADLGTYANALNGKLDFGAAGRVTGLGGAICAELDLGPGCTEGSYACFEAELNCPASGLLGARTSFFSLNAWGANVAAVDTGGFLFDLGGVTAGSDGAALYCTVSFDDVGEITHGLRVQVAGLTYFLPLIPAAQAAD